MLLLNFLISLFTASSFENINESNESIKLIAVGDMMIVTNFPSEKYLPQDNGRKIFENVKSFIQNADIAFGNLEGTILSGEGEVKSVLISKNVMHLRVLIVMLIFTEILVLIF